jgi:protein-L-isoaspartate(D-aspartate) O-methyltransferase
MTGPIGPIGIDQYRRFFAEEIEAVAKLRTAALVDALATVPREQFLRPGPWGVLGDTAFLAGGSVATRTTVDADPRRVYHNIAVAIDPSRHLFNGQPSTVVAWIDALALTPGAHVLHIGCGLGYYTAIIAHVVGAGGRVVAYEVDPTLAAEARANLTGMPWVDARHGDACGYLDEMFNAILVNAGATHPLGAWLDALAPGASMVLPLTGSGLPGMSATIGKGVVWQIARRNGDFVVRPFDLVAIYSAVAARDDAMNERLGKAMMAGPAAWRTVTRLRRDAHEATASCWLHGEGFCFCR